MATYTDCFFKTFTATAVAITQFTRVKYDSSGLISAASASELAIGVAWEDCVASGQATVRLWGPTTFGKAGAAIARAAAIYPLAAGKIDDAVSGTALGLTALEAATADNDVIELAITR